MKSGVLSKLLVWVKLLVLVLVMNGFMVMFSVINCVVVNCISNCVRVIGDIEKVVVKNE